MKKKFHEPSNSPLQDLEIVTYEGQDPNRRMYKSGYESFMSAIPIFDREEDTDIADIKFNMAKQVMKTLGKKLSSNEFITNYMIPEVGGFNRTILAIESPEFDEGSLKERAEVLVAKWGDGFSSPVHGHSPGFIHEELITGKMLINMYRKLSPFSNKVRPVNSYVVSGNNTIASIYAKDENHTSKRHVMVHNFKSIGYSASLHFLPEHTRDGRDNGFEVEYFNEPSAEEVVQINTTEGLHLKIGDVVLVRSSNVPEYGDHYIVITGHPVVKDHGLRPQDEAIVVPDQKLLDQYTPYNGVILLKLNDTAKQRFYKFHDIKVENGKVVFPNF